MKYISASNPQWANAAHTAINLNVEFNGVDVIPFSASASDAEDHGQDIFARAVAGEFGPIVDFQQPSVEEVRIAKRREIVKDRNATITGGFSYMGKQIDSDRDSVISITGAAVAALAAKDTGQSYSVDWTCADDSVLTLNADGVLGMAVALAMFADVQHNKARLLKAAIKSASDEDTVKKVHW